MTLEFGHDMRSQFLFDTKWRNLNHGSYGTYSIPVRNAKRGYTKLTESFPDKFLRYQYINLLDNSREKIAQLVNAPADECVFVENATTALNTVLRNLVYKEKDVIIYFDTIYGAIEKTLASVVETNPQLTVRKVGHGQEYAYQLPMSHPEIASAFSQTISRLLYEGYNVKAAVFDTVVSIPGVRFPFERLVRMCKEYGILSVVDGAHSVGMIPLNLSQLDADFFTSNCHKWLYTPRGCALLHVPKRNQHLIRTTFPTSHGYTPLESANIREVLPESDKSAFIRLFQLAASGDRTAYYCVPAAINFRHNLCGGEDAIYNYIRENAQRGADMIAMLLGTEVMDDADPGIGLKAMGSYEGSAGQEQVSRRWIGGLRDCALANVVLPITILGAERNGSVRLGPGGAGSGGGLSPGRSSKRQSSPSLGAGYFAPPQSANGIEATMIKMDEASKVVNWLQETLISEYNTFVAVYEYHGQLYVRISGQIYLELKDWEWLGGVLKALCERVGAGEFQREHSSSKPALSRGVSELDLEKLGREVSHISISGNESSKVVDITAGGWRRPSQGCSKPHNES
ncbi:hypothetical protein LTR64_000140 [Lithohypha guttulata]|uniref:uncharacterized protein n=1 Tax=Lithohypha guttulata TaxID=1690604 RepID=UPI002DDEEB7D|nr:hypothetical protein LTR51_007502 [Lithohypha guttulata]